MSVHIQSAAWKVSGLTAAQKLVLVSLADQANDEGFCWPSLRSISGRTGIHERHVRRSLAALSRMGHMSLSPRGGRSTVYAIHPGHPVPPDILPTPDMVPHHPGHGARVIINESSISQNPSDSESGGIPNTSPLGNTPLPEVESTGTPSGTSRARPPKKPKPSPEPFDLPDWVPATEWQDYVTHRLNLRHPFKSASQVKYAVRSLEKLREAGNDPAAVLAQSIANGWQGLFEIKNHGGSHVQPDVHEQTRRNAAIALDRIERRERARAAGAGGAE